MSSPGLSAQDRLNEVKDLGLTMQVVLECNNEIPVDLSCLPRAATVHLGCGTR